MLALLSLYLGSFILERREGGREAGYSLEWEELVWEESIERDGVKVCGELGWKVIGGNG